MLIGACVCGRVRYEIDGKPRFMYQCHCAACGSPIYSHGENTKQVVSVRCGTLRQDPGVRLAYHAFVGSKAPWTDIQDGLPQFDDWPDPELVKQLFNAADG